jgi:predicted MFS family arabinose efflux permease
MTLNSAVQSAAMGLAALVGGYIINRNTLGLVENYGWAAVVGGCASVLTIVVGARLQLHPSAAPAPK